MPLVPFRRLRPLRSVLQWLRRHDPEFVALRRSGRTAIVMPTLFAVGDKIIRDPEIATFAAFGSFAMLLLVDFTGPIRARVQAQAALAAAGAVLICLGTLASRNVWVAATTMTAVAFVVIFAGVVSSVLANATTPLLLALILPVSLPAPASAIPARLAGWGLAGVVAVAAVAVLWPAPPRNRLRSAAAATCRGLAARMRAEIACALSGQDTSCAEDHDRAVERAGQAVDDLQGTFLATPYRPTGLSTTDRAVVRLVDELGWLAAIISTPAWRVVARTPAPSVCQVKFAACTVLERAADLLDTTGGDTHGLRSAMADLRDALARAERSATSRLPAAQQAPAPAVATEHEQAAAVMAAFDASFRAQELSFAVSLVAGNVEIAATAERRGWRERVLGRGPDGASGLLSTAQQRARAHTERNSVWLHNSVRGALGLGLAVAVANLGGVQHSFWVALGTLSVLRSNALNTGQSVVRSVAGTAGGFLLGAVLLAVVGTSATMLWILLPPVVLLAGLAPAALSFTAGQAAFTLTLMILFHIIQPAGWVIGLVRVEDVALGCAVSLLVGLLLWPRGAGAALRRALAEAYTASSAYLAGAVQFGMSRCDGTGGPVPPPARQAVQAAAAARRLDDAFREFLAERGSKRLTLAQVTGLVTGVAGIRLAADAVLDLWRSDDGVAAGNQAARQELLARTGTVTSWYDDLAGSLLNHHDPPEPLARDVTAEARLVHVVRHDLQADGQADGQAGATAVRMIWTNDHVDAVRRLQAAVIGPARAAGLDGRSRPAAGGP